MARIPFLAELGVPFAEGLDQLLQLHAVLLLDAGQLVREIRNCTREYKKKEQKRDEREMCNPINLYDRIDSTRTARRDVSFS